MMSSQIQRTCGTTWRASAIITPRSIKARSRRESRSFTIAAFIERRVNEGLPNMLGLAEWGHMARSRGEKGWAKRVVAQVPAKIDGVTLEQIQANLWRDGVRMIDPEVFNQILNLAGEHGPETGGVFRRKRRISKPPIIRSSLQR
jgi:hypothetical protein